MKEVKLPKDRSDEKAINNFKNEVKLLSEVILFVLYLLVGKILERIYFVYRKHQLLYISYNNG